jgi:hypothetical protein
MSQNAQSIRDNNTRIQICINQAKDALISEYEGDYIVTPTTEQQTLPTKGRALTEDVVIEPITPGSNECVGIEKAFINEDGNLIICYSNGE